MLSLSPLLWRRLDLLSVPCIAFSFWALVVLVQIKVQIFILSPMSVLLFVFLCCLLLLGFIHFRWWKRIGMPGILLLASIASYVAIGSVVGYLVDADLQVRGVGRQVFFLLVTLAALLGGRSLLERAGVEAVLLRVLAILTASCIIVLATPALRSIGLLPEYRLDRYTGTFSDPNDAGFMACMTVALALAFQSSGSQTRLRYLALILGYTAALSTVSHTAMAVLGGLLTIFLLVSIRRLRQNWLHTGLVALSMMGVLTYFVVNLQLVTLGPEVAPPSEPVPPSAATLQEVNAFLTTVRGETNGVGGDVQRRTNLWKMGVERIRASPLFGHGLLALDTMEGASISADGRPHGVHNMYLMLVGETGLIPLSLYVLSLLFLVRLSWIMPASLARDAVVGWTMVMALYSVNFHHLFTMGTSNLFIGLSCAGAGFLLQNRQDLALEHHATAPQRSNRTGE